MQIKKKDTYKKNIGLNRFFFAAKFSINGIRTAIYEESAFRQEIFLAIILIPYAIFLPVGSIKTILMIFSVLLVLIIELLNSGIEAAIDRISKSENELSKRAKDYASAAVMISIVVTFSIYICFTIEYFQNN